MSIIELENVTYRYPLDAEATIKNIDLSIEEGKVYGLIGSNQSGRPHCVISCEASFLRCF